jgi:hypothetical protein
MKASIPRLIESSAFYSLQWNAGYLRHSLFKLSSGGSESTNVFITVFTLLEKEILVKAKERILYNDFIESRVL